MAAVGYITKIHVLLSQLGKMEHKKDMVLGFTCGRTDSTKGMNDPEAILMIQHLEELKGGDQRRTVSVNGGRQIGKTAATAILMKRKIIAMAHECGWKKPSGGIDMKAVNTWCETYGYCHKKLDDHTYKELPKLLYQFENGPYLSHLKKV